MSNSIGKDEILNRLKTIFSSLLKASQDKNLMQLPEITIETDLFDDLGLDSVELLDLMTAISEEFKIELSPEQLVRVKKVGDVVNCVSELKNNA